MKLKLVQKQPIGSNPHQIDPAFYTPERDGVTQGVLAKFLDCRQKVKLALQGWTSKRIGPSAVFGTLVHAVLEHVYRELQQKRLQALPTPVYLKAVLKKLERQWKKENPRADAETVQHLEMSLLLCEAVLPVYFLFWRDDFTKVQWLALEHEFKHPWHVNFRRTFLRGKQDGRFHPHRDPRTWLFETKTKSRLGEQGEANLVDTLPRNLQVNMYLGAIQTEEKRMPGGVLYNIIRKPMLRLKKKESISQFAARVATDVKARPAYYFLRMRMKLDRPEFERELEQIDGIVTDFLRWFYGDAPHYANANQCENKYGQCEFLRICAAGDYSGHYKRARMFSELTDEV